MTASHRHQLSREKEIVSLELVKKTLIANSPHSPSTMFTKDSQTNNGNSTFGSNLFKEVFYKKLAK